MSRNVKVNRLFGHYPTMVANGRGGHPRHRYSSRLRMNPDDDSAEAAAALAEMAAGLDEDGPKMTARVEQLSVPEKGKRTGNLDALAKARLARSAKAAQKKADEKAAREAAREAKRKPPKEKKFATVEELNAWRKEHGKELSKLHVEKAAAKRAAKEAEKAAAKAERAAKKLERESKPKRTPEELKAFRIENLKAARAARGHAKTSEKAAVKSEKAAAKAVAAVSAVSGSGSANARLHRLERLFASVAGDLLPPFKVSLRDTPVGHRGRPVGSKNKAKESTQLVQNGSGRGYMASLLRNGRPKGSKNKPKTEGSSERSAMLGPYKFTLLKNPVVDFEIGGIKVVPALVGIAGTSLLTQIVGMIPQYKSMDEKTAWYKPLIPGAVAVAVAALAYSYAKKKNHKLGMQVASDIAAFGMYSAGSGLIGDQVKKLVDMVASPATPAPAPTPAASQKGMNGGRYEELTALSGMGNYFQMPNLTGGVWANELPQPSQLNGYVINGSQAGYPQAFLTGGLEVGKASGYAPVSMYGGADSTALKAIALAGGQQRHLQGHSMSDYAD